jgi:membrane protease YdiL (CAAX protease family)
VKRFLRFVRSLTPVDASQLALPLGALCLFLAAYLPWLPWQIPRSSTRSIVEFRVFVLVALCAIRVSACAGFFLCFRPGPRPAQRLFFWVTSPAALGIFLICSYCVYASTATLFLSSSTGPSLHIGSILWIIANLGPGFHYALLGFILISLFHFRLTLGHVSLPLTLPGSTITASDDTASWKRVELFLWVLLWLLNAIHSVFPFQTYLYYLIKAYAPGVANIAAISAEQFVTDALILPIAIWIIGKGTWYTVLRCLRLPEIDEFVFAVGFPIGIAALVYAGEFLFDLTRWVAYKSHGVGTPWIGPYFSLPRMVLLVLLFHSLGEEIIFRGLLQPRFIRRYGLFRGLALLSVVFAAAHLSTDFSAGLDFTDGLVILKLCVRLISSIGLCSITGWLMLRSGSVLPAALAHGIFNIMALSPLGPTFPGIGPLNSALSIALAYVLFRYWPIHMEGGRESRDTIRTETLCSTTPPRP